MTNNEHLDPNFKNLYDEVQKTCKKFSDKPCLGVREKLGVEEELQPNGKYLKKLTLKNEYAWSSYTATIEKMNSVSNGLLFQGLKSNDNIVLFMETRAEWLITAFSCFRIKVPVVTLYATLGVEAFKALAAKHEKKVLTFNEIVEDGQNNPVITDFQTPEKNDLAIIMYTSGSTGNPKVNLKSEEIDRDNVLPTVLV